MSRPHLWNVSSDLGDEATLCDTHGKTLRMVEGLLHLGARTIRVEQQGNPDLCAGCGRAHHICVCSHDDE